MKRLVVALTAFPWLLLTAPGLTPADQVSKDAVILKEIRVIQNKTGVPFAKESVYGGGIGNIESSQGTRGGNATLRELRPLNGSFTFAQGKTTITVKVVPLVAERDAKDAWSPALGRWDFNHDGATGYESAIHVKMGGDLDIAYQSTKMRLPGKYHVLHYGLSGNPHAISLSRKRLKQAFASPTSSAPKPILEYEPAKDMILVQMEFTPEGFRFQPIFDYEVVK